jgi:hypothetical protein
MDEKVILAFYGIAAFWGDEAKPLGGIEPASQTDSSSNSVIRIDINTMRCFLPLHSSRHLARGGTCSRSCLCHGGIVFSPEETNVFGSGTRI